MNTTGTGRPKDDFRPPGDLDEKTVLAKSRWDSRAAGYDQAMSMMDRFMLAKLRRALWSLVKGGRVLEVGAGTGANFAYYPKSAQVTAIDLSEKMVEKAREKAQSAGIEVDLRAMDAQHLDFPDDHFDYVVATCVFCSVPDPVQGLRELARVCKADGKVLLLEHVRSETPMGYLMDLVNPLCVRMVGPNINRRTVENVRKAGLVIEHVDSFFLGIVKLIVAHPPKAG